MSNEYIHFNNNAQPAINEDNLNLMQQLIKQDISGAVSGDTLPIGAIIPYSGATAPTNWLICDGSAISRTTYQDLFNVIGTAFGVGDGSTTFNLPDMRGRVPVGVDTTQTEFDTLGETGGTKTVTLTKNELPTNDIATANTGANSDGYIARAGYTSSGTYNFGGNGQPHNNLQPYQTTNYIIKAFQTAGVVASIVNARSTSTTDAYSANYVNGIADYSTSEKVCGTWIDGKPLYRKVVYCGALPNNTTKQVAHNIQNLKRVVHLEGFSGSSTNKGGIPLPYSVSNFAALYINNTDISLFTNSDRTAYTETYVFIEYTKTTD